MSFKLPDHTFVIAEAGINHQGSLELTKQLIDVAVDAGCDAIKFQKRTPRMALAPNLWDQVRDTPWGVRMTYIEYRERIELSGSDYREIDAYCKGRITWFASPWDKNAANTLGSLDCPIIKIPSACVTDIDLINHIATMKLPVIMSTGMCNLNMIQRAFDILWPRVPELSLLVCTSTYPAPISELNLARINMLKQEFPECRIGYSGHEAGLWTTLCAVAMGATIIERHITLDRAMPGSDHAASVEPQGLKRLVKEIRNFEQAKGDGLIGIRECEQNDIKRLRKIA